MLVGATDKQPKANSGNFKVMTKKKRLYASDIHLDRDYAFAPGHYFRFDYDALLTQFPDNQCWLVALDDRQINVLLHMLSIFPKYYKNWGLAHKQTWDNDTILLWDEIETFVSETECCLMSGCDLSQLNSYIERVAIALESLDEKTPEYTTLSAIADDLEDILTISNPIVPLLRWFISLFPSFDFKVRLDATQMVLGLWEYITWKSPILVLLGSISAAQTVQAIAQVGSGFLSFMGSQLALLQGWVTLGKDMLLGDFNIWDDWLKPLYYQFISTGDGGDGGDNPDDSSERIINRVFLEGDVMTVTQSNQQIVNCGGSGGGCGGGAEFVPSDEEVSGSDLDGGEYDLSTQGEDGQPPDGFDDWDEYNTYKCQAANAMTLGVAETFYQIGSLVGYSFKRGSHAATAMVIRDWLAGVITDTATAIPDLLGPLKTLSTQLSYAVNAWFAERVADMYYPVDNRPDPFQLFFDLRLNWLADRSARVCELFNATNTSEVRGAILAAASDYIDAMSYDQVYKDWALGIISGCLTNVWCNILFTANEFVAEYSDETAVNCGSECIGYHVVWGYDHGNGLVEAFNQGDQYAIEIIVNGTVWAAGPSSEVGWTFVSGNVESTDDKAYRIYDSDLNLVYEDDDPPTNPYCLHAITLVNDDGAGGETFTVQFSIGASC